MYYYVQQQCPENHYPYVIQAGDTLYSISRRLEVSLDRILAANPGINPNRLMIGQVICIPACFPNQTPYIIQPGDTLFAIARAYNVTVDSILRANPGINPNFLRVGQRICIPVCPENHTTYIIRPGDTLFRIAQLFNVTVDSIIRANPGIDPNSLRVAQRICIPIAPPAPPITCEQITAAMQRDIDMLAGESSVQRTHQSNYGNSTATTRAVRVTATEIQFEAVPVTFSGNYIGHFTQGQSYPYYEDAAAGGQRGINVKDNFGVWHSFGYRVSTPQ